ncbi:kinesin-like protein KIF26A [Polymixia lowei]
MYSQYWNSARGQKPDYRRFTVVEGDAPLPLGSTHRRKRLNSAPDEEAGCGGRPTPEGSLSVTELGLYGRKDDEPRKLCQKCQFLGAELNRQALALADPLALKEPAYAAFLFDKLQRLQWPQRGRHGSADPRCEVCGTDFHQLRRLALSRALGFGRDMPDPQAGAPCPAPVSVDPAASEQDRTKPPHRRPYLEPRAEGRPRGRLQGWGGVQSTYLGGGVSTELATVTPLSPNARHYLEGVWRVSCPQYPHHHQAMGSDTQTDYVTMCGSTREPLSRPAAHSIATQTSHTPSSAASFFIRAAQKLSLSRRRKSHVAPRSPEASGPLVYTGGFSGALQLSPPAVPPCLLRAGSKVKDNPGMGKVKVMVRICSVQSDTSESMSFLKVDARKKQLTLCETSANSQASTTQRRSPASAPKIFAFDAVFSQDASQAEVCSGTVAEVIQSVVNGADGCIFCFGHANLGKTYTMIGRDCSTQSLGVAPTAVSWLFKVIEERKEKAGARFSVHVSAVEISGREETLTDLLAQLSSSSSSGSLQERQTPGVLLEEDPVCGSQLQNQTELRVSTAERAACFLDAALAARSTSRPQCDEEARRNSHLLFTLHLYQHRMDKSTKGAMSGGRSRLHLLDLGSCETDISRTREGGGGQCLSLSALGNVILALANGAKHVPYRDSKLTMLLRESLGNINCRTTMIAHISDSPTNYMETLTTVQLASRIHRMRKKKSKYASSSSGGESSCEEGRSCRPPHLRPFHPRTVALDPDTPGLLSSDPDYSSSSEHSCDTVIYVGPGGAAISDRELSDNEGPPAFVPIIPSLNKKRLKDTPRSDGDHFKCNTFAELQERLDCIDGSEGPAAFTAEGKAAAPRTQNGANKPTDTSPPKPDKASQKLSESTVINRTNKPDQEHLKFPSDGGILETSKRTSADGEKVAAPPSAPCTVNSSRPLPQDSEPVVREKVYLKGTAPKPSASPSLPRAPRTSLQPLGAAGRFPPVGMSQQALRQDQPGGSPVMERAYHMTRSPMEVNHLRAALLGRCLDRDFLRTTVTLQQPVELNGEDELVFTVVEELPVGLVPDNGRPSSILSFNNDYSLQALASGSRPVSIISSINDEYDAYTSQQGATGISSNVGTTSQEVPCIQHGSKQSSIGSWPSEVSVNSLESESTHSTDRLLPRAKCMSPGNISMLTSPSIFRREPFLQHGAKSSLNDSGVCFSELDSDPATPSKLSFTKCPPSPDSTKASLKASKVRASTLNTSAPSQIPHHAAHSSLPRKNKPTSSAALGCSKQEGKHDDLWLQGSSHSDPREVEFLSAGKPARSGTSGVPFKKPGGNSNSVPRPPKAQVSSSTQRVVDGCEKTSSRRGDTLIKMPRLTRGATTLGTVSVTHSSSESKWGHDGTSATGSLRFASLGKRSNGQKSSMIPKSGSGSISPPAPPARQWSLDQKARIPLSPSALKTNDVGKSAFPKTSVSEEEFNMRLRADSFGYKTSSLKTEHCSSRATSSLKSRGAKGDSSRFYGSLMSLEKCDSLTSVGSKPALSRENSGASLVGNSKSNRSVPRLGVPASTSVPAPPSPSSPGVFSTATKLGQVKGSTSSRAAVSGGSKARTLSASTSKSLSSTQKPLDNPGARNASLPPTGRPPPRSGTGTKPGRGTIMGTKQAISRAANSRVSELAAGSHRKQLSRESGVTGSNSNDSGTSVSGSPACTPIPSPYSKITAPRRPQRYSSGHGSDNSSVLSGELPPAMGRTALFYHSGGSSGYESMIRDSETTGSASSAHDSMSESGVSLSNRSRVSKSPKKRGNGFQRRRLIPAPLPDASSLGRKAGGQWVDLPPLGGSLKEPFEIKVYEIDDVERLQRRREGVMGAEQPFHDVEKGLLYFNARLRMLEKRQQEIRDLRAKHERLKAELEEAKGRLMLDPGKWSEDFDVDQDLDKESQEYLEVLAQTTAELEYCVNLCKSRVMMETCFDIAVPTTATTQGGPHEVDV